VADGTHTSRTPLYRCTVEVPGFSEYGIFFFIKMYIFLKKKLIENMEIACSK
jgi:hypothetical protein